MKVLRTVESFSGFGKVMTRAFNIYFGKEEEEAASLKIWAGCRARIYLNCL